MRLAAVMVASMLALAARAGTYWMDDYAPLAGPASAPPVTTYGIHLRSAASQYGTRAGLPEISNELFTVACWFRAYGTDNKTIWSQRENTDNSTYWLRIFNNQLISQGQSGGSYKVVTHPAATANNGEWHLAGLSKSGATVVVWMDARSITNGTDWTGQFSTSAGEMRWGSRLTEYFHGGIDEAAVWSRMISDAEWRALYNSSNGLYIAATTAPYNDRCIAAWRFDDNAGTSAVPTIGTATLTFPSGVAWTNGYVQ